MTAMARFTKKKKVALVAAALVLTGGTAFAYWTAGGSGTGTAATGTNSPVVVKQTSVIAAGALYPGGSAVALAGNFNNANSGPTYVTQVSVVIDPAWTVGTTLPCTASDFTLVQPAATNADVAVGTGVGSWAGASILLKNLATNQDNCKNVTVPLIYTSN
jgi:hypothetical protein